MKTTDLLYQHRISLTVFIIAVSIYVFDGNQWLFLHINALQKIISGVYVAYITMFGDAAVIVGLMLPLFIRNERFLYSVVLLLVIGGLLVQGLKGGIAAPRPPAVIDPAQIHVYGPRLLSDSFPSGHSFSAWSTMALLSAFYSRNIYLYLLFVLAVMVSLSRVVLGVHWPLDILFGGLLGWWLGGVIAWFVKNKLNKSYPYVHGVLLLFMLFINLHLFWYENGYPNTHTLQYGLTALSLLLAVINARTIYKARR